MNPNSQQNQQPGGGYSMPPQQPMPSNFQQQPMNPQGGGVGEDPGKTLGIVSVVCAFFFPLAGIITGIMSRSRSKKAGFSGKLGLVGLLLSLAFIVLSVLFFIIMVLTTMSSLQDQAAQQQAKVDENKAKLDAAKAAAGQTGTSTSTIGTAWQTEVVNKAGVTGIDLVLKFTDGKAEYVNESGSKTVVGYIAQFAAKYPDTKIALTGFASSSADTSSLPLQRAELIKSDLIALGVPTSQIDVSGTGNYDVYFGQTGQLMDKQSVAITLVDLLPGQGR